MKLYLRATVALLCGLAFSICFAQVSNNANITTLQQQVKKLASLKTLLNSQQLDTTQLDTIQKHILLAKSTLQKLNLNANQKIVEQSALLKDSGPITKPPSANQQSIQKLLTTYQAQQQQIKLGMQSSVKLIKLVATLRTQLKAKLLIVKTTPLYKKEVLITAVKNTSEALTRVSSNVNQLWQQFLQGLKLGKGLIIALITIILGCVLLGPLRLWLNRHWATNNFTSSTTVGQQIKAVISSIITRGMIPAILFILVIACIQMTSTAQLGQQLFLRTLTCAAITFFLLTAACHGALAVKAEKWRIPPFSNPIAKSLSRQLHWLIALIVITWIFSSVLPIMQLNASLTQLIGCWLQILVAINLLLLLRKKYWLNNKKTSSNAWKFTLRLIIGILIITNPILIIIGYVAMANMIFSGLLTTLLLLAVLFFLQNIFKKYLNTLFSTKTRHQRRFLKFLSPKQDGASPAKFWLGTFINIILWFVAICLFLLIWGMDPAHLSSLLRSIFFGVEIGGREISLVNIVLAAAIFFIIIAVTRYIQNIMDVRLFPNSTLDSGAQNALKTAIKYLGFAIAIVISVNVIGFDLSSLLLIVGGLSVGIGLGLQPIVTNFVSGIIMLIERPVKVGDQVEIGGQCGIVTCIKVRATEIRTFQRASVLIPNSSIITGQVKNWTLHNRLCRIEIPIGVAYGSDIQLVKKLLLECSDGIKDIASDPTPSVVFMNFGDNSLDFELRLFTTDLGNKMSISSAIRFNIEEKFSAANIEIPFPQRDVHLFTEEKKQ